jgi:hypothetical protein
MTSLELTLRIPRGLWHDLEESVYQQDRQFLTEVARSLGLPPADVIRRCLGVMGQQTALPILWTPAQSELPAACPYWDCRGDGLWRRCSRLRLSSTLPCGFHERTTCRTALDSDPTLQTMETRTPVLWQGALYWVDPTGAAPPFNEEGFVVDCRFKRIRDRDDEVIWVRYAAA